MAGISLLESASFENFNEAAYFIANPDVFHAVREGRVSSAEFHFRNIGHTENRSIARFDLIRGVKAEKIRRIKSELLLDGEVFSDHPCGAINCLPIDLVDETTANAISAHPYELRFQRTVDENPNAWILDDGAGFRPIYFTNVVNYEIAPFVTTDVIGFAERLPFQSSCFDFVISNAVLEHLRDPFTAAKEIVRVLKPGGIALVAVPFLQPYHGYPHHYFNMTRDGLRAVFSELEPIEHVVPFYMHPIWALQWFLSSWSKGLEPKDRDVFTRLTVGELLKFGMGHMTTGVVAGLSEDKQFELASGTLLVARKPQN